MSARQLVRVRQKVRGALGELPPEMKKDEQMPQVKDKDDVEALGHKVEVWPCVLEKWERERQKRAAADKTKDMK